MVLLNLFSQKQKKEVPVSGIKVGDWVTQYSAGYWKVVAIFPKYADADYSYNGISWKRGDRLGDWIVLKKGVTPKMKPGNACEFVDGKWCQPVSAEIVEAIEAVFAENAKAKEKFDKAPNMPNPSIATVWLTLTEEQAAALTALLPKLPERVPVEQFWDLAANYRQYSVNPAKATHTLQMCSYVWEINDCFEQLQFGPELKEL